MAAGGRRLGHLGVGGRVTASFATLLRWDASPGVPGDAESQAFWLLAWTGGAAMKLTPGSVSARADTGAPTEPSFGVVGGGRQPAGVRRWHPAPAMGLWWRSVCWPARGWRPTATGGGRAGCKEPTSNAAAASAPSSSASDALQASPVAPLGQWLPELEACHPLVPPRNGCSSMRNSPRSIW